MADPTYPLPPGGTVVVTGQGLTANPNTAKTRWRVTDGRPVPPPPAPALVIVSSITGGILSGKVPWTATVTVGKATAIEFYIDGVLRWTESFAPYTFNGDPGGLLDTTTLPDGPHALGVLGVGTGATGLFAGGTVTIANGTPVPPPPDPPGTGPSGIAMPTTDPAGWKTLYKTDFNIDVASGSFPGPYAPNMSCYPWPWQDTAKSQKRPGVPGGFYDPAIITVKGGVLDMHIQTIAGSHRVAAPTLTPNGEGNYPSIRTEICFRADSLPHYKTAWLFWPESNTWPRDGEIDWPERNLDSNKVSGFVHPQGGGNQAAFTTAFDLSKWHVVATEWKKGQSVEFFLDGVSIGKTTSNIPNTPMHAVIQTETSLDGVNPSDSTNGHVQLDWVRFLVPA